MKEKCCLAIDPVTCKDYMVSKFARKNIKVFAVFTDSLLRYFDEFTSLSPVEIHKLVKNYLKDTSFNHIYYLWEYDNLEEFRESLSEYDVFYVLNGNEYSLEATKEICRIYNIEFNSDETVQTVQSKYEVNEVCRNKGIPVCREILKNNSSLTISDKRRVEKWGYPIFAKPVHGCGSLGVSKLSNEADVIQYLKINTHSSVLLQEYLKGREYFIDIVSYRGQHYISLVGVYKKDNINNVPVYNYAEIVPFDTQEAKAIILYLKRVLDLVGWKNGLSHNEIIYTNNGPVLIEINGRQSGAHNYINKLAYYSYGRDQFDILIDCICNNSAAKHKYRPKEIELSRYICLNNFKEHKMMRKFNAEKIIKLQSYKEHTIFVKTGEKLPVARSLADVVGNVMLINKDRQQLKNDYAAIYSMMLNEELF
jgi:biotin carboxylase